MKRLIAFPLLALMISVIASLAGEPAVSSKQVIVPPAPPPPEYFRGNEFDIGLFGTYATGVGSGEHAGKLHAWGGGLDFTYWFPWKYAGMRFQGAGVSISGNGGSRTREVTVVPGFAPVSVTGGGGNVAAGIMTGDFMLRLPLDDFMPGLHLAPYGFVGFGGILLGGGGNDRSVSQTFTVTNAAGVSRQVTFTGKRANEFRDNFGSDRVLGHFGGGLEYRFTPHIGLFAEAGYDIVNGAANNFIQTNFGLRFAF